MLSSILPLALALAAQAALSPVTNLNIYNKVIAPDGFNRSWALFCYETQGFDSSTLNRAVVVEGSMPGPLIAANKASWSICRYFAIAMLTW